MGLFGKKKRMEDDLGLGEKLTQRTSGGEGGLDLKGTFDEAKMTRYQMAIEKKAILFDKEVDGVDYTHMDFVLSTGCGFYRGMTNLQAVQLFWKAFYPYLKSITDNYEKFYDQFSSMIDDQEEVLRNHAELDFRHKWTLKYIDSIGFEDKHRYFIDMKVAEATKQQQEAADEAGRAVDNMPSLRE